MNIQKNTQSSRIKSVETTEEKISGRGGLPLFLRYTDSIGIFPAFEHKLCDIRKSRKGLSVHSIARQLVAFMADGTNVSVSNFNHLKKDPGYAAVLESTPEELLSSHSVHRFFKKFTSLKKANSLRQILIGEFIRQLRAISPKEIVLDIDTMVLDNSEANCRHGVKPTYKKGVKGFQNLQVTWNGILVDAIFRNGSAHSNHGNDFMIILRHVISTIRKEYRTDIPITITMDSGFFSEDNLVFLADTMGVTFIAMGKVYNDLKVKIQEIPEHCYDIFEGKKRLYRHTEFFDKRECWEKANGYRAIHTQLVTENNGQAVLDFIREDSFIYTNNKSISREDVINHAHNRGRSELTNRSFKEFLTKESLPFKNFGMNAAWYFMAALSHSLLVGFRNEIISEAIYGASNATPQTIRRQVFDIAAKIIRKGNAYILKLASSVYSQLNIEKIWQLVNTSRSPIPILSK
jgi:hypothetical protein